MKNTKLKVVKALMDADKNISVKEICEKSGFSKSQVYSVRHQLNAKKKLTRVNKKPKVARPINLHNEVVRLNTELVEMRRLAMYWKQAYDELDVKTRGNSAVIEYLESKIQQLFK